MLIIYTAPMHYRPQDGANVAIGITDALIALFRWFAVPGPVSLRVGRTSSRASRGKPDAAELPLVSSHVTCPSGQ